MKLHRLVLTNYRGITHREIEFPDRGVVVVSGANEVGKSSMIEALDLLLHSKDRSNKKDVKQVKPTHADVGAEITAEISTGPYRFIFRKRFHKRCESRYCPILSDHRVAYGLQHRRSCRNEGGRNEGTGRDETGWEVAERKRIFPLLTNHDNQPLQRECSCCVQRRAIHASNTGSC